MKQEYDLKVRKVENGYLLTIVVPAPEEAAAICTSWEVYLANQEDLFSCISIYYDGGPETAIQYACAAAKEVPVE